MVALRAWERTDEYLAHGIGRERVVLEAALTVLLKLALLLALTVGLVLLLNEPSTLDIDAGNLAAAAVGTGGLAFLSAAVGILTGAITGRRSLTATAGALIAALGFVLQALAKQSADIEWLGAWSPFTWVNDPVPLIEGWNGVGFAQVWILSLALIATATLIMTRRDIT